MTNYMDKSIKWRKIIKDLKNMSRMHSPYTEDDIYNRTCKKIIDWHLKNPNQIPHIKNEILYC